MHIGNRVREVRKQRGWTQSQLAERAGLNRTTLAMIEIRGATTTDSLASLAVALNVRTDYLIGISSSNTDAEIDNAVARSIHLRNEIISLVLDAPTSALEELRDNTVKCIEFWRESDAAETEG